MTVFHKIFISNQLHQYFGLTITHSTLTFLNILNFNILAFMKLHKSCYYIFYVLYKITSILFLQT
ncbi:hypothetical protein C2G38_2109199 [Gigaspora rosea]|uniref:Uncharacterized protein n=1 Tax=Gigaspora rosea TaxID=44941 RepID=A0A397UPX7_9GLOM|nr:hypothetical protein C2G38_2109199 [Gigaspora rosea]